MEMSSTTTSSAPAMTSSMSMGMASGSPCKVSMLWNWYTIDACFLSSTWHITSHGMFAGSCIGVISLVLSLEFLRRLGKEYERSLARQLRQRIASQPRGSDASEEAPKGLSSTADPKQGPLHHQQEVTSNNNHGRSIGSWISRVFATPNKPSVKQQLIRALLHMLQFGVAYFIMLLAMYYNGYIIICILIGAFLGSFIFGWESIGVEQGQEEHPTVCCG